VEDRCFGLQLWQELSGLGVPAGTTVLPIVQPG
jgi:hypothetical protein